jgi:hypothetical protein
MASVAESKIVCWIVTKMDESEMVLVACYNHSFHTWGSVVVSISQLRKLASCVAYRQKWCSRKIDLWTECWTSTLGVVNFALD